MDPRAQIYLRAVCGDDMSIMAQSDHWPADTTKCTFLGRAIAAASERFRISPDILAIPLWQALKSGLVQAGVHPVGVTDWLPPMPLPPSAFLDLKPESLIALCQIEWRDLNRNRPARIRRAVPVTHWVYVTRESFDHWCQQGVTKTTSTVADEARAVPLLAARLKEHPEMRRKDALGVCREHVAGLTARGFLRVWPKARVEAGLLPRQSRSEIDMVIDAAIDESRR